MESFSSTARGALSHRRRYLIVGTLGLLCVGIIYAWSILKAPLAADLQLSGEQLSLNYTLTVSFFCIGSLASGFLGKRLPVPAVLLTGAACIFAGFALTALLRAEHAGLIYLSYGVLVGFGVGAAYNCLFTSAATWFPDHKGTSSGILMTGFALSSLLWSSVARRLFSLSIGWRVSYVLMGAVIALFLVAASFLLRRPDSSVQLPSAQAAATHPEDVAAKDYTTAEMMRRPSFWIFMVYGVLAAAVGSTVFSFAGDLSEPLGGAAAASLLVGVLSVFNSVGRILCGLIFDRFGRRRTMFLATFITLAAPLVMVAALLRVSLPLGLVSLALTGISFGSAPTINSAFTGAFYGMKYFSTNYSVTNFKLIVSSFAAAIAGSIYAASGTYVSVFIFLSAIAGAAFVLNFFIRRP